MDDPRKKQGVMDTEFSLPDSSAFEKDKKSMAEWSELPIDVLEHLTSFLPLPDYHRFSAVCQNWWMVAKQKHHPPAKQLPWLLVRDDSDPHKHRVFSISENRHYNIDFPELQGQYVCGSSYGWLFTVDKDQNFKLLNPLMGKSYDLPQFPCFYSVETYLRESKGCPPGMTYEQAYCTALKAILDHDPAQRSDFTVFTLAGYSGRLIYLWRPGNLVWTELYDIYNFGDLRYYKGKVYAFGGTGDVPTDAYPDCNIICTTCVVDVGMDPKVSPVAPKVPLYAFARTYLVDFRGELLMLRIKNGGFLTGAIIVYKLDLEEGKYYPCHHLDGYSLFLGNSSPLVIDPSQFPGCKENRIYFTSHVNDARYSWVDNGIYDMLKGTVSPFYPPETSHPAIVGPIWWDPNPW